MTFFVKIVPPGLEIVHFFVEMPDMRPLGPGLGNLCQVLHSGVCVARYF